MTAFGDRLAGVRELALYELLRARLCREIVLAAPAAGSEVSQVAPSGMVWELLSFDAVFTASAVVATRTPSLRVNDVDGNTAAAFASAATAPAGLSARYCWSAGLGVVAATGCASSALPSPGFLVQPGWKLTTVTGNLDAGDQWSQPVLYVREWSLETVNTQANWLADRVGC